MPARLLIVLLYGALLVAEIVWSAVIPLAPVYKQELGLGGTETGVLVGAASVVILVASIPAGLVVDRLGAGWPTVAASLAVALSCVGQGFASSYVLLVASRGLFGLGMAIVWSSALVWLAEVVSPERRTRALAFSITLAGMAGVLGPGFAGLLAGGGVALPYVVLGIAAAAIGLLLAPVAARAGGTAEPQALLVTFRRLARSVLALAGLALFLAGGLSIGALNLLVPLSYDAAGVRSSAVGLAFSVAGCGFLATSALISRAGDRAATLRHTSRAVLALAALSLVPIASETPAVLTGFLLVRGPLSAVIFTCAFPLAMLGARAVDVPSGAVLGLANAVWAVATFVGPAGAGVLVDVGGRRLGYAMAAAAALVVGSLLLRADRRSRAAVGGLPAPP